MVSIVLDLFFLGEHYPGHCVALFVTERTFPPVTAMNKVVFFRRPLRFIYRSNLPLHAPTCVTLPDVSVSHACLRLVFLTISARATCRRALCLLPHTQVHLFSPFQVLFPWLPKAHTQVVVNIVVNALVAIFVNCLAILRKNVVQRHNNNTRQLILLRSIFQHH